jgi:hypothetical protein
LANFNYVTGKIQWAKVLGDPVPNFSKDGFEWTFDLVPNEEGLALFAELGIMDKMKKSKTGGPDFIRFTQKKQQANGRENFPITVVDARNRPWDPKIVDGKVTNAIGNDSLVEVKFKVNNYGVGKPTGVYPQAIRILEHKEYVRQEFAPLPEDSPYVHNFDEEVAVEEFAPSADEMGVRDPLED